MDKSPQAFRTISEVSESLDVPSHVLRFWESKFPQVKPVKRGGGRRYYRPEDVALLVGIRELLYEDGLTIKGVQKILRERGARSVIDRGAGAPAPVGAPPASPPASTAAPQPAPNGAGAQPPAPPASPPPSAAPSAEGDAAAPAAPAPASPAKSPPEAADPERVRAAIARLEALRDRLRTPPSGRG